MNILITGGSRGLGFETARMLVRNGHNICICAKNENELKKAWGELNSHKVGDSQLVYHLPCDVAQEPDIFNKILY